MLHRKVQQGWSLTPRRFVVSDHPGALRHPSFVRRGFFLFEKAFTTPVKMNQPISNIY